MWKVELFDGHYIYCHMIQMGTDYTFAVYGGDTPHVGSVVMSIARPSLTGQGIGVTTSVLSAAGHKDEIIARQFAETLAKEKNCTVVCACGIHVDDISTEQIEMVRQKCDTLLISVCQEFFII